MSFDTGIRSLVQIWIRIYEKTYPDSHHLITVQPHTVQYQPAWNPCCHCLLGWASHLQKGPLPPLPPPPSPLWLLQYYRDGFLVTLGQLRVDRVHAGWKSQCQESSIKRWNFFVFFGWDIHKLVKLKFWHYYKILTKVLMIM